MSNDGVDWSGASEQMARDVLQQGETFLQAQFASAIASDQRATTMAGLMVTVSTAIFAGVIGLWDGLATDARIGGLATAALLLSAALAAAWAARPIDFWFPGSRPEQWYEGIGENSAKMLGGAAELVQEAIDENETFMAGNQTALRLSFVLALSSPLVGLVIWRLT